MTFVASDHEMDPEYSTGSRVDSAYDQNNTRTHTHWNT